MRLALAVAALIFSGSSMAAAQDATEEADAEAAAPVIIVDEGQPDRFGTLGDFTVGFGRPRTFDSMRLDVRESLRPRQSYGPGPVFCSPSIPDC